jgi:hypothetical protein
MAFGGHFQKKLARGRGVAEQKFLFGAFERVFLL